MSTCIIFSVPLTSTCSRVRQFEWHCFLKTLEGRFFLAMRIRMHDFGKLNAVNFAKKSKKGNTEKTLVMQVGLYNR